MHQRIEKLQQWLNEETISAAFITNPKNVFYFSGFRSEPHERLMALIVRSQAEPVLVCPKMDANAAKEAGWNNAILSYEDHEDPWVEIKSLLANDAFAPMKIAVEADHLTFGRSERLRHVLNATLVEVEPAIHEMRMIKDEDELAALKKAAEMADFAIKVGTEAIKKGKKEQSIVAEVEYELAKRGYPETSFTTMVLTGDKTATPHGKPGDKQIKEGDFVLFDLGFVVDGYCSDITRTVCYKHADDQMETIYNTVNKALDEALAICHPGTAIGKIDQTARNVITEAGYGDYFPHRVGHGLGIDAHEAPSMSSNNESFLKAGMVITVEPGIYVPGVGGVRIEDDVLITEDGPVCLTQFPKDLTIIE